MSVNASLFNELVSIYTQLGKPVPHAGRPDLKGSKRTAALNQLLSQGRTELSMFRQRQLQDQMMQARRAQQSMMQQLLKPKSAPKNLQSTLASGESGVRGARSRQQKLAMQSGVRAANPLQAGAYLNPAAGGGGQSATPYGSSINLA